MLAAGAPYPGENAMPDTELRSGQTPEELLESEIEDLERRTLNSGWLWVAAAAGLVVLAGAAFLITNWDHRQAMISKVVPFTPEAMVLKEPRGTVDRDLTFRWEPVATASSYILLVKAASVDEVEILRPVRETFLRPSETEVANLNPGAYTWTVEARSAKGQLIGYGEGAFTIAAE